MALACTAALNAALQATALEALAGVATLRLLEGPPAISLNVPAAVEAVHVAPVDDEGKQGGGKKDVVKSKKPDRKGGPSGVVLGKGSALMRAYVERAASAPTGKTPPSQAWGGQSIMCCQ
jgi:hypothetical protein